MNDSDGEPSPARIGGGSPLRRRRWVVVGVVIGAVVVAGAGLLASTLVKSPQQVAAEAQPPSPSVITAPVRRRVLRHTIVLRGKVKVTGKRKVKAPERGGRSVITARKVTAGAHIHPGQVIAEVSGRPVFALSGAFPAYRNLHPGMSGKDVTQLQRALRGLGYSIGDPAGRYGAGTAAAVAAMYHTAGYHPHTQRIATHGHTSGHTTGHPANGHTTRRAWLPVGEVVFLPHFPARVITVSAHLGDTVSGSLLTVASGKLLVHGTVDAADRKLLHVHQRATVYDPRSGHRVHAKVTALGKYSRNGDHGEPGSALTVTPSTTLHAAWRGREVQVTVHAARSKHKVLLVPESAVYSTAGGGTQVRKLVGGRQVPVRVDTGMHGDGYVRVKPRSGNLRAGDNVVVGR